MYRRLVLLWFVTLCFSCGPKIPEETEAASFVSLVVKAGTDPFWFELGSGGPEIIPSPAEASLSPFVPWTGALFITAFLPVSSGLPPQANSSAEFLFAGVNRWGILGFEDRNGETAVYYYPGGPVWKTYPAAALFRYGQKPAALLRGDFFSSGGSVPAPALWITGSAGAPVSAHGTADGAMEALALSVFEPFPPGEGWETSAFFYSGDYWYFRESRPAAGEGPAYYRTRDLSAAGQKVSEAAFWDAAVPRGPESAPPLLALAMEEAERLAGKPCIVTVVSPDFPSSLSFCSSAPVPAMDEALELSAYYRSLDGESLALVLFPGGKGVFCRSGTGLVRDGHFTLPELPAGGPGNFRYTGIAAAGNVIVASWEEQEDWTVGAAGFLMLEINW